MMSLLWWHNSFLFSHLPPFLKLIQSIIERKYFCTLHQISQEDCSPLAHPKINKTLVNTMESMYNKLASPRHSMLSEEISRQWKPAQKPVEEREFIEFPLVWWNIPAYHASERERQVWRQQRETQQNFPLPGVEAARNRLSGSNSFSNLCHRGNRNCDGDDWLFYCQSNVGCRWRNLFSLATLEYLRNGKKGIKGHKIYLKK